MDERKPPWLTFLFLTSVFVTDHVWAVSQTYGRSFSITPSDFAALAHDSSPLRVVAYASLGFFGAISLLLRRGGRKIETRGSLIPLSVLFVAWAATSFVWSEDPATTSRRVIVLLTMWVGAFAVCQRLALRDVSMWVFGSTMLYLHLGLTAEIVLGTFKPLSEGYRFAGTLYPNMQGVNCALLFLSSTFLLTRAKRWRWPLVLIACEALVFLLLTKSRTSVGSVIVASIFYWLLTSRLKRMSVALLCGLLLVSLGALFSDYVFPVAQSASALGRTDVNNLTLTGRTYIWQQALPYVISRPIQGYGLGAFWTPRHMLDFAAQQQWNVPNEHSSYLRICLELGLVGLGLYIWLSLAAIGKALAAQHASPQSDYGFFCVILIFLALVTTTESILLRGNQLTFLWILVLVELALFHDATRPSPSHGRRTALRRLSSL